MGSEDVFRVRQAAGFDANRDIRIGFVGIFDTVVSTGGLVDGLNVRDEDDRGVETHLSQECARKVVHLVARDEMRANFILTSAAPHQEIRLPGVHSDVGGSYRGDHEGPLCLTRPIWTDEGAVVAGAIVDEAALCSRSAAYRATTRWLHEWQQKLHLDDPRCLSVDSWAMIQHRRDRGYTTMQPRWHVYAAVKLDRPIRWEYQLIPFRLMHKLAVEAGVAFKPIPDEPESRLPVDLNNIARKLLAGELLSGADEALLSRKYLHQSAHWNADFLRKLGPAGTSADLVYVSRPDLSGKRTVRPNQ